MTFDNEQNTPPATPDAGQPVYGQQQPYSQQQPAGYAYAPTQPTNTLAIVSLVLSILGVSLVGVILGHVALGQIKTTGAPGRGIALAGVIVGYAYIALTIILIAIYAIIALVVVGAGSTSVYN